MTFSYRQHNHFLILSAVIVIVPKRTKAIPLGLTAMCGKSSTAKRIVDAMSNPVQSSICSSTSERSTNIIHNITYTNNIINDITHTNNNFADQLLPNLQHSHQCVNRVPLIQKPSLPPGNKTPKRSIVLPPCAVCGERATGFHYGANTCEACKGFFRRCLVRNNRTKKCKFQNQCVIGYQTSRDCAACRHKKCLEAGMSKEAIKIGRHTYEKKTKDIQEVKRLKVQAKMTNEGTLCDVESRQNDLEKIINTMTATHISLQPRKSKDFDLLLKAEEEFLEKRNLENMMFGPRKPISLNDYNTIYRTTGLDVDGRKQTIARLGLSMQTKVKNFLKFANTLPGYSQLPPEDQKLLSRASVLDRAVFMFSSWYNTDSKLMFAPQDPQNIFSVEDMVTYTDHKVESFHSVWKIIKRAQNLDLTEEETTVAAALALMNGEYDSLTPIGRDITSASVDYLVEALAYLIQKNHDPEDMTLCKIITIMADTRPLLNYYKKLQVDFIQDNEDLNDLFLEYMC